MKSVSLFRDGFSKNQPPTHSSPVKLEIDISTHSVYTVACPVYDVNNADFAYYSLPKGNLDRSRSRHGNRKNARLSASMSNSKNSLDISLMSPKCLMKKYFEGAWFGQVDHVKEFLDAGYDINLVNDATHMKMMVHMKTMLHLQFLVSKGADVNLEDAEGNTAIEIACWGGRPEVADYLALRTNAIVTFKVAVAAAKAGSLETVKRWYSNLNNPATTDGNGLQDALCTATEEGQNLLHIACENDHPKIASYLIEQGQAKKALSQMDGYGETPIHIMIQNGMIRVIHEVMRLRLKEYGIVSPSKVCDWFIHLSKKYCKLVDLGSVFFLPMAVLLQQGRVLPHHKLSQLLVSGANLQDNSQVLYISHTFGNKQLGFLFTLILTYLQREGKNYDYIWIDHSCLSNLDSQSSAHAENEQELASLPLAMFRATDVLVLPGLAKDPKNGIELLDILSYSSCLASQSDLVMAGLLEKTIYFGFFTSKFSKALAFCGCSNMDPSTAMDESAFQKAVFFFETEHRSRVFEEFALACCKNALGRTSDKTLFQRLNSKLLPSKSNDFEYIEPSDLLCSMTLAILSMDPDSTIKLCSRNLNLTKDEEDWSSELRRCYKLFDHTHNLKPGVHNSDTSLKHGTDPCVCSAHFINLCNLVYHIVFLLQHDFETYNRFLNDLPLQSLRNLDASGFEVNETSKAGSSNNTLPISGTPVGASGSEEQIPHVLDDSAAKINNSSSSPMPKRSCLKNRSISETGAPGSSNGTLPNIASTSEESKSEEQIAYIMDDSAAKIEVSSSLPMPKKSILKNRDKSGTGTPVLIGEEKRGTEIENGLLVESCVNLTERY